MLSDREKLLDGIKHNHIATIRYMLQEKPDTFFVDSQTNLPPYLPVHEIAVYTTLATFKAVEPDLNEAGPEFEERFFTTPNVVNRSTVTHLAAAGERQDLFLEMIDFSQYARTAKNTKGATPVMFAAQYCDEQTMLGICDIARKLFAEDGKLFAVQDNFGRNAADYAIKGKKMKNLEIINKTGVFEFGHPLPVGDPAAKQYLRVRLSRFEA